MEKNINYAKKNLLGKVHRNGNTFDVGEHIVSIIKKKGRTLMTCSCFNDCTFCVESPMCSHKISVILYLANKPMLDTIDKLLIDYKIFEARKLKIDPYTMINDLKDLKRL